MRLFLLLLATLTTAGLAFKFEKGVESWLMFGATCGITGCGLLGAGNNGGWAGLIAAGASWVQAAGLQFSDRWNSGLRKRDWVGLQNLEAEFKSNASRAGFHDDDLDEVVRLALNPGSAIFRFGEERYGISTYGGGKFSATNKGLKKRQEGPEIEMYGEERIDIYGYSIDPNELGNAAANEIVNNLGGNQKFCALYEVHSEEGGYAYFSGAQMNDGSNLETLDGCDNPDNFNF